MRVAAVHVSLSLPNVFPKISPESLTNHIDEPQYKALVSLLICNMQLQQPQPFLRGCPGLSLGLVVGSWGQHHERALFIRSGSQLGVA